MANLFRACLAVVPAHGLGTATSGLRHRGLRVVVPLLSGRVSATRNCDADDRQCMYIVLMMDGMSRLELQCAVPAFAQVPG